VYENIPAEVSDWARRVGRWSFTRIIPCHFDAPIAAGPREWNAAFGFLPSSRPVGAEEEEGPGAGAAAGGGGTARMRGWGKAGLGSAAGSYYPNEDMVLLRGVEDFLQGAGQGLKLVPISTQLELIYPPWNPT